MVRVVLRGEPDWGAGRAAQLSHWRSVTDFETSSDGFRRLVRLRRSDDCECVDHRTWRLRPLAERRP